MTQITKPIIKFAYDPKTKVYMVSSNDVKSNHTFEYKINGEITKNIFGFPYLTMKDKPTKIEKTHFGKLKVGLTTKDKSEKISLEEYDNHRKKLSNKGYYDDDYDKMMFNEVEDEVHYIRFINKWTEPIYADNLTTIECDIEIIEHPVSEYEYIIPTFALGIDSIYDTVCTYKCDTAKLFDKQCEEYGLKPAATDNDKGMVYWNKTHRDSIRFVKIGGNYASNDTEAKMLRNSGRGSYEDMKLLHQKNVKIINECIERSLSKMNQVSLDSAKLGNLISYLENARQRIIDLDVKVKDSTSQSSIVQSLSKKIQELRKVSLKNEK